MSTFMAYGAVDLRAGVPADRYLTALRQAVADEPEVTNPVAVWVGSAGNRVRITVFADWGNTWLGGVLAEIAEGVERALLGLDHDEYGVEHVVLDGHDGTLRRVHHVYVYPEGEVDEDCPPTLVDLPARADLRANPDGTLTGADALAAAAALFEVSAERMVKAVRETAAAHDALQIVFEPLAPWWEALGVTYPMPALGEPTHVLERKKQ